MKSLKILALVALLAVVMACDSDDGPKNNPPSVEDTTLNISTLNSDLVTTIIATDLDNDTLTYEIESQTPANSVAMNSSNGEVYVLNASAFDYNQNQNITVNFKVSDGTDSKSAVLTINILERS